MVAPRTKTMIGNALLAVASVAITGLTVIAADRIAGRFNPPAAIGSGLLFTPYSAARYETLEFDCTVYTNNLGFRGDDTTLEKRRKTRVVALGDSYTYGWGVALKDTWIKQVEALLRTKGQDLEILNLGVPGHGPGEYADTAEKVVPVLKPDVIVVGLLQGDDLRQLDKWRPKEAGAKPAEAIEGEAQSSPARRMADRLVPNLSRLLIGALRTISPRMGARLAGGETSIRGKWKRQTRAFVDTMSESDKQLFGAMTPSLHEAFVDGKLNPASLRWLFPNAGKRAAAPAPPAPTAPAANAGRAAADPEQDLNSALMQRRIDRCRQQLDRIRKIAEQNGARMVVVSIPETSYVSLSGWQILFDKSASEDARRTRDANFVTTVPDQAHELASNRAGVPMVHVTGPFREKAQGRNCFYAYDGHFTPEGNHLFAELLAPVLEPYLR